MTDEGSRAGGARASEPESGRPIAESGRPLVERIGLGAIAVVLAGVFAFIALAAWTSGEVFLTVMAVIGALMTVWAAVATMRRG